MILFNPQNYPVRLVLPHFFFNEKTEAQTHEVIYSRLHSQEEVTLGLKPSLSNFRDQALNPCASGIYMKKPGEWFGLFTIPLLGYRLSYISLSHSLWTALSKEGHAGKR